MLNNKNYPIKFIQISDIHIQQDKFLGINTKSSYIDVINAINNGYFMADFIIVTGDLVQEESIDAYAIFIDYSKKFKIPVFWIPGNHDYPALIKQSIAFEQDNIKTDKHLLLGDKWQLIMLDSQFEGKVFGYLKQQQLEFLEQYLAKYPDRYSIVALHHHLLPTGSKWLDQHDLKNSEEFFKIVDNYSNLKLVIHGHIHQELSHELEKFKIVSAPATSIQFLPKQETFKLDLLQPGWNEFILYPDGFSQVTVKRLSGNNYMPDLSSNGY